MQPQWLRLRLQRLTSPCHSTGASPCTAEPCHPCWGMIRLQPGYKHICKHISLLDPSSCGLPPQFCNSALGQLHC